MFCGNELPANLDSSQSYWIKYQTDATTSSNGFLAEYKYLSHSDLEGENGLIESPNYPKYFTTDIRGTYRITVKHGSVIRIEFPTFYMEEEEEDECFSFIKVFNGFDDSAPLLQDELCSDLPEPIISDTNVVLIEFQNNQMSRTKFQLKWQEIDKVRNMSNLVTSECEENKVIALTTEKVITNITSPGFPTGYSSGLDCTWAVVSTVPSFHPVIVFRDIDLEDVPSCIGDYVVVSTDRDDGSWREHEKLCTSDIRDRKSFDGTPNIKLRFRSDFSTNRTGFYAYTYLECGGKMTEAEGVIDYNTSRSSSFLRMMNDCKWNITVRRGKTIQFEFLEMNIQNTSSVCNTYVTVRNGIDDSSPYLGDGQYCGKTLPTLPPTSSNRAFVKYKVSIPQLNSFRLRYYEVQHQCGGEIKLLASNSSTIISSPNYPNIPPPHIECTWTIIGPIGEQIRIDFVDRFDLTHSLSGDCDKEYVELRDGSTSSSQLIGTFCTDKPTTKYSRSNVLLMKFFTDVSEPKNGFKANISIGVCGGMRRSSVGILTSPKYPGKRTIHF